MTFPRILLLVALTVASRAMAMSSRPDILISFHLQGSSMTDSPKSKFEVNVHGQNVTFLKSPEFTQENILAFYPFEDKKTHTWGVFLRLDNHGKRKLEMASQSNEGSYLIAMINAKPVDMVVLDKPITDGAITIWQGIPETVIKTMKKKYRELKPGEKTNSASDRMDMDPSTPSERKTALPDDATAQQQQKSGGFFGLFKAKPQPKKEQAPPLTLPEYGQDSPATGGQPAATAPITSSQIRVEGGGSSAGMSSPSLNGGGTAPLPPSDDAPPAYKPAPGSPAYIKPLPPQPKAPGDQ